MAMGSGAAFPLMTIIFGSVLDTFVGYGSLMVAHYCVYKFRPCG
jgi:hypothetical protein